MNIAKPEDVNMDQVESRITGTLTDSVCPKTSGALVCNPFHAYFGSTTF